MIIVETDSKERIDSYLSSKLDLSRSKIQKLIKEEKILVNNKSISSSYQVKTNDQIEINGKMRSILIDWIIDIHYNFGRWNFIYGCFNNR